MLRKTLFVLPALVAMLFAAGPSYAVDTPDKVDGFKIATTADVQKVLASGGVVVDARVASESADSKIKGAIAIPYREISPKSVDFDSKLDEFDMAKLPADKAKALVFYCNGIYCWKSYKAAVLAVRAGHKDVYWFRTGMDAWKAANLPVE